MKIAKNLKEFLKAHNLTTITEDGDEVLYIKDSHGPWEIEGERYKKYKFYVGRDSKKVWVRICTPGVFQCGSVPWKGEDPEDMYFDFVYAG